jgi:serine/threonine-protein kinase
MPETGEILEGRFRIERPLGKGGMASVYLATHLELSQPVALKEMKPVAGGELEQSALRQIYHEARLLVQLRHARLPHVHDFFKHGDCFFLVLDYIEGETLDDVLVRSGAALSEETVLGYARDICDVLCYLHEQQPPVIFRDLKPSNIMVATDGHVKLIDFGISKLLDVATGEGTLSLLRGSATHGYAPPEQYVGSTDARSDVYALGATLYHLLTNEVPPHFAEVTAGATLRPVRELAPAVSARTAECVENMLSFAASMRPQTIRDVAKALGFELPARAAPAGSSVTPALQHPMSRPLGDTVAPWHQLTFWKALVPLALLGGMALGFAAARLLAAH